MHEKMVFYNIFCEKLTACVSVASPNIGSRLGLRSDSALQRDPFKAKGKEFANAKGENA